MSNVAKGNAFEDEVYSVLSEELERGRLGLDPSSAKIFKNKGYFSSDRKKDIVVDISIEVWPPGATNYALLWVCECKNYQDSVPVDDIEEFKAKLDQISGKNVKGVLATRRSFQSGALIYAQNQGIGLVRIMPANQVTWLMHLITPGLLDERLVAEEFIAALTNEHHEAQQRNFYAFYGKRIYGDWNALLQKSLSMDS